MTDPSHEPSAPPPTPGAPGAYNLAVEITIWRFLAGPAFVLVYHAPYLAAKCVAMVVLVAGMLTDLFDGIVARRRGLVTDMGKILDPLADVAFFQTVYLGFMLCTPEDPTTGATWIPWWIVALLFAREVFMHGFLRPYVRRHGYQLQALRSGKLKTIFASSVAPAIVLLDALWVGGVREYPEASAWFADIAFWLMFALAMSSLLSLIEYGFVARRIARQ